LGLLVGLCPILWTTFLSDVLRGLERQSQLSARTVEPFHGATTRAFGSDNDSLITVRQLSRRATTQSG
jgi:hypothetical protein